MSNLRRLSRSAHAEAWDRLTRFRRLRRLTQQALRARARGDLAKSARIGEMLRRMQDQGLLDHDLFAQEPAESPTLFQKGKGLLAKVRNLLRRNDD